MTDIERDRWELLLAVWRGFERGYRTPEVEPAEAWLRGMLGASLAALTVVVETRLVEFG